MNFRVERATSTSRLRESVHNTPQQALDAAIRLMTHGATGVRIIDPLARVFAPAEFAKEIRRRELNWASKPWTI
jgi:hypothetical protein